MFVVSPYGLLCSTKGASIHLNGSGPIAGEQGMTKDHAAHDHIHSGSRGSALAGGSGGRAAP